jgi:hypothetical protein
VTSCAVGLEVSELSHCITVFEVAKITLGVLDALAANTIKQSVEVIRRSGMDVDYEDQQDENGCQIVIRIRRNTESA